MMDDIIKKYLEKKAQDIKENWIEGNSIKIEECKSPLEKLFLIEWEFQHQITEGIGEERMGAVPIIIPQYKIDNYKVDFMIFLIHYEDIKDLYNYPFKHKELSLIVEVDSYLWHGSTPEQFTKEKERERELISQGFKLLRFSGKEILHNTEKCITETIAYFSKYVNDPVGLK